MGLALDRFRPQVAHRPVAAADLRRQDDLLAGAAAGAVRAGLSRYRMAPGERAMPVHVHADEEELFYVLGGIGLSWQDGRTYAVAPGDCVVHRASAESHTIVAGDLGLDVLAFSSGSDTH